MDWLRRIIYTYTAARLAGLPRGELIGDTSSPLIRYSVRVYAGKNGSDPIIDFIAGDAVWGAMQMNKVLYGGFALPELANEMAVAKGAQPNARMNGEPRVPLTDECQAAIRSHPKWEKLRDLLNKELKAVDHIS
jgi:hypothetical protein